MFVAPANYLLTPVLELNRHAFDEIVFRRNAFTHPTSHADLATPPGLVLDVRQASLWFLQQLAI
jgi:hypothetical protein